MHMCQPIKGAVLYQSERSIHYAPSHKHIPNFLSLFSWIKLKQTQKIEGFFFRNPNGFRTKNWTRISVIFVQTLRDSFESSSWSSDLCNSSAKFTAKSNESGTITEPLGLRRRGWRIQRFRTGWGKEQRGYRFILGFKPEINKQSQIQRVFKDFSSNLRLKPGKNHKFTLFRFIQAITKLNRRKSVQNSKGFGSELRNPNFPEKTWKIQRFTTDNNRCESTDPRARTSKNLNKEQNQNHSKIRKRKFQDLRRCSQCMWIPAMDSWLEQLGETFEPWITCFWVGFRK